VRRWAIERYTPDSQLWHTEDRYEVVRDGEVVATEVHRQSPAGRWYSQAQAAQLYRDEGFMDVRLLRGFTHTPASVDDTLYCVLGVKPLISAE